MAQQINHPTTIYEMAEYLSSTAGRSLQIDRLQQMKEHPSQANREARLQTLVYLATTCHLSPEQLASTRSRILAKLVNNFDTQFNSPSMMFRSLDTLLPALELHPLPLAATLVSSGGAGSSKFGSSEVAAPSMVMNPPASTGSRTTITTTAKIAMLQSLSCGIIDKLGNVLHFLQSLNKYQAEEKAKNYKANDEKLKMCLEDLKAIMTVWADRRLSSLPKFGEASDDISKILEKVNGLLGLMKDEDMIEWECLETVVLKYEIRELLLKGIKTGWAKRLEGRLF